MFQLDKANYDFEPVKFNVDESLGDHIKEPFPNKSFFWVICGKPGSGKTSLLINTLVGKNENRVYRKVFDKILLVMPSNSRASMKNSPFEDLPTDQQFERFDSTVVDRIMALREEFNDDGKKTKEVGKFNEPMGKLDNNQHSNAFSNRLYDETKNTQNQIVSDLGKTTPTEEPKPKEKKNRNMLLILDDITAYLKDDPHLLIELTTNRRH